MKVMSQHVVVVGSGIVGTVVSIALARKGHRVSVIGADQPDSCEMASYGNAGWLNPGSVVPLSMPGLWRKVPEYLLNANGPLTLRLSAVPQLASWLVRFMAAGCTPRRARAIAAALRPFLHDALERHEALAREAGVPEMIKGGGLLIVYPDRAAYGADALGWSMRRDNGVAWRELEGEELRTLCPGLSERYQFGALITDGGYCTSPGGYTSALATYAAGLGVTQVSGRVSGFRKSGGQVLAVEHAGGEIACDRVVIAGGIGTTELARMLSDTVPLVSERGYHVQVSAQDVALPVPTMMSDLKFGITPMGNEIRGAGQVEFARRGRAPDWRRARIILECIRASFPSARIESFEKVARWMGNRPSTPDCLPVIGVSPHASNVVYASGHGHLGLVSSPYTADIVADLIDGVSRTDIKPYDPARFCRFRL
ncbi:FAD-dependent oxidoreductase [Komagataeibacter xylinus]|uniref:FAD-dependent oxidoreductase n=2 Tax=Komagataeibacter xylinus TaxID=28448 RepID=A0A318PRU0_KOMXY|nr:FAD-dependent oxidoreductase [Komagataeibacter xylinus]